MNLKTEYEKMFSSEQKSVLAQTGGFARKKGINAYLIGGVVRDLILNRPLFDIDIVVECDAVLFAQQLVTEVKGEILGVQENLRTAKVLFENGVEADFSSTRKEFYKSSGQLPVLSEFGCPLSEDVKRRDFTVNTLALKLGDYELIDFLGGEEDIKNKQLRVLHDKSFIDDPSRLVRMLKFAVRFGFDTEAHTKKLMTEYLNDIDTSMPLERIKGEFRQLFSLNNPLSYTKTLLTGVYKLIGAEPLEFSQDRLDYCLDKGFVSSSFSWFIPLACLTVNSKDYWERLNLTSQEKRCLSDFSLLLNSECPSCEAEDFEIYERYSKLSEDAVVCEYTASGSAGAKKYLETIKDVRISINGNDLISLGFVPSEQFKMIFDEVLKQKLSGKLKTKEEELEFVKRFL
ncbi:CCA tRNA nucleotidyltransferase [bacterium]|nr:CCA tRNA nucleotidyltransferase [bacterium]